MKKKPLAFGSLERKFDWLSVAFFTSLVPYKMPYIILDLLAALPVVQEVQKYKTTAKMKEILAVKTNIMYAICLNKYIIK